ncbi:BF3164 family lipoprotein [Fodinibius halophilus]|uniref:6-bladed beta-propeller n=1 Tax=Fodinibius halophilus TaxID=1736908 RepID=A0A6M1TEX0_9BACT|nr:BF3164 family lipoprotein [Fodinibius halophilus]NGP88722.1 6-bladed beta-propeller [Fodinibius halophilus]
MKNVKSVVSYVSLVVLLMIPVSTLFAQDFSEIDITTSEVWEQGEDPLYNPAKILSVGDYVVIVDKVADKKVRIYDPESKQLVKAFGKQGKGPNEYLSIWNLFAVKDGSQQFCIYDIQLRRVTCYDLDAVANSSSYSPSYTQMLSADAGLPLRITGWPQKREFITTGIFKKGHRFITIDSTGSVAAKSDEFEYEESDTPLSVIQHAYTVLPTTNGDGTKVAFAYFYTNKLDIYSVSGKKNATVRPSGDFFPPLFSVCQTSQGTSMAQDGDTRLAYIDVSTTADHIYALYSGRKRSHKRTDSSDTIHVFDWNGNRDTKIHLDREVTDCTATAGGENLLCLEKTAEGVDIIQYSLPKSLSAK